MPPTPRCPVCSAPPVRAETGWACPKVLEHLRILSDADAAKLAKRQIENLYDHPEPTPA